MLGFKRMIANQASVARDLKRPGAQKPGIPRRHSVLAQAEKTKPKNKSKDMSPTVEIKPDHHFTSKVYTTGSNIDGHISISTEQDLPFDDVDICFVGVAQKRLELAQLYLGNIGDAIFLKQDMPVADDALPSERIFKAGEKYSIPFSFILPRHLTSDICEHPCNPELRERHLELPPTMGFWDGENMCSDMTTIGYYIHAGIMRRSTPGSKRTRVGGGKLMLKVLPASQEEAPLHITDTDDQFILSKKETIRQGFMSGKSGELHISASQPGAVMLSGDGRTTSKGSVRVRMEFIPFSEQAKVPNPKAIQGKVESNTYYGPLKLDRWPHLGKRINNDPSPILNYAINTSSFEHNMDGMKWTEQPCTASDNKKAMGSKQVAEIDVSFSVCHSEKSVFIPTFHSCHFSRTYTLHLNVCNGVGGVKSTRLAVPLQIGVEPADHLCNERDGIINGRGNEHNGSTERLPKYDEAVR